MRSSASTSLTSIGRVSSTVSPALQARRIEALEPASTDRSSSPTRSVAPSAHAGMRIDRVHSPSGAFSTRTWIRPSQG